MIPPRFISFLIGALLALVACKVFGQNYTNPGPVVSNPPPREAPTKWQRPHDHEY